MTGQSETSRSTEGETLEEWSVVREEKDLCPLLKVTIISVVFQED